MVKELPRNSLLSGLSTDNSALSGVFIDGLIRRTRRRFTQEQLTMLDGLFCQTQLPSTAQRAEVANLGNMYLCSSTCLSFSKLIHL